MTGALIALAAKGAQDVRLTYQPQTTFWKSCYKRHTNFAIETIEGQMTGQVALGNTMNHTLQRNADLASRTYLKVTLPRLVDNRAFFHQMGRDNAGLQDNVNLLTVGGDNARYVNAVGFWLIESLRCKIGGHEFDVYSGASARIMEDLQTNERNRFRELIGDFDADDDAFTQQVVDPVALGVPGAVVTEVAPNTTFDLYIPLYFWWSHLARDQSLPLIGLQYHTVNLELRTRRFQDLITFAYPAAGAGGLARFAATSNFSRGIAAGANDAANISNARAAIVNSGATGPVLFTAANLQMSFLIDFVFLDTRERKAFSCKCLEYLIEQTQELEHNTTAAQTAYTIAFNFNHPVRYVSHYFQFSARRDLLGAWDDWTGNTAGFPAPSNRRAADMLLTMGLRLNNQFLDQPLDAPWLRLVEPADHGGYRSDLFFYTRSFALDLHQQDIVGQRAKNPSGSINFSRIDNIDWSITAGGAAAATSANSVLTDAGLSAVEAAALNGIIHARNYNYAKVAAGQMGLFYAN